MNSEIKNELHKLIDNCDNELLLSEAKSLFESKEIKDWWNELSEEDKNLVLESEAEYEKGNFISHQKLMQQFKTWKN